MEQQFALILAAVVAVVVIALASFVFLRWRSFNSRIDRRRRERREFEAAWGAVIKAADARAEQEKMRAHHIDRR